MTTDKGQQGVLSLERLIHNAILGNSHPCDDGYLMFTSKEEVDTVASQVARAIALHPSPATFPVADANGNIGTFGGYDYQTTYADLARLPAEKLWNRYVSGKPWPNAKEAFLVARAIPFVVQHVAPADDGLEFNAQRLRNVVKLVGLESAVPQDDAALDGARGAVLGQIAAKLKTASIPADTLRKLLKDAELGHGSRRRNYDGNTLGHAIEDLLNPPTKD